MPDLVFLIQVSFLLFWPCLLVVSVWIGKQALDILEGNLARLHVTFDLMEHHQKSNGELLVAILSKVIVQGESNK